uniref:Uncharacterized protein n=1 Tax=Arundo donax TaxID=35708 RepID=A0A0A9A2X7_ARUDO
MISGLQWWVKDIPLNMMSVCISWGAMSIWVI